MLSFASRANAYLRAAAGVRAVRTGPFTVRMNAHDAGLFFSYAIPDDGAEPTSDQVRRLIETDAQLREVAEAQGEAYEQPVTTEHDVARLRAVLDRGGLVALALRAGYRRVSEVLHISLR